jgi:hypothetical protein
VTGDDDGPKMPPDLDIEALGKKVVDIKNEKDIEKKLDLILDMELTSIRCNCEVRDWAKKKFDNNERWKLRMGLTVGGITGAIIALASVLWWLIQIHVGG